MWEVTPFGSVQHGEGELHSLGGISARTLIPGLTTSGRFAVVEHRLRARELAAPLHLHHREDEYSMITHGRVGFVLGDDVSHAGPGDLVRKPRHQWHTFFNAGEDEARLLEIISPAGFEDYFTELAAFFPADAPPDLEGMAAATERYGLEMDFGSLERLIEQFDLVPPAELS